MLNQVSKKALGRTRINRNIVECKCVCAVPVAIRLSELIETLWNVNLVRGLSLFWPLLRINRNIVECKLQTITTATIAVV